MQEHMEGKGIRFRMGSTLSRLNGLDKLESVEIDGQSIACDMLVLAVGVRGNTGLARDAGLLIGRWGIKVNQFMQTSDPDIYAIGDCVEIKSRIDGRDTLMQLAVAAYKQGVVAGNHICGQSRPYHGALCTFATKIGSLEAAATGFASEDSPESVSGKASGSIRPEWCHSGGRATVKLISARNGKLLGCQAVGEGASERVNIASAAIQAGFSAYDLSETELCYCPAVSDTYDILMQAADNLIRRLEGGK
jgi:NADH oxidase (H2O2-forming)